MSLLQRIVIADDDPQVRTLLVRMIGCYHGHMHITEVDNGLDALRVCISQPVDLLITDNQMPGMWGVDLAHALRLRKITIPIVMISGSMPDIAIGLEASINHFLTKPISLAQLTQVLAKTLRLPQEREVAG